MVTKVKGGGGQTNNGPLATDDLINLTTVDTSVLSFIVHPATLLANDAVKNGNDLTISSVTPGSNVASVQILPNGDLQVVPTNPFAPSDTFQYTVSDGHGGTSTGHVTVNYTVANSPPVISGVTTVSMGIGDPSSGGIDTITEVSAQASSLTMLVIPMATH